MQRKCEKALLIVITMALLLSVINVDIISVQAAEKQKIIKIVPKECKNVDKILPEPTKHMKTDKNSDNYSYVFKINLTEASKLRITGLARYTFWYGNGEVNYKLTDALSYSDAEFVETWQTQGYADHTGENVWTIIVIRHLY